MSLVTFKNGIHPFDGKSFSKDCAIQNLDLDGDFVFPMSQHIGAPARPVVAVGDHVFAGQKVGEAGGFVSANIISSVSGTVKAVGQHMTNGGAPVLCVTVESDGKFELLEGLGKERSYKHFTSKEIVDIVREAGIVGVGGAGFPTSVKLGPKNPDAIDYFICNGSECEPYITSDYRLILEEAERIIGGLKICLKLFPKAKGVIAIEDNKPDAIAHMEEMTKNEPNIEVVSLKTKYPAGGERMLIQAVTGRAINSQMLPADAGVVVDNVATLAAIYDAVKFNLPMMQKVITVSGDAVVNPSNFRVRLGSSYKRLLEAAGGTKGTVEKYINGGPMMGMALFDLDVPVTKPSSALLAMSYDPVAHSETTHCIRCGRCILACPEFMIPPLMYQAGKTKDIEEFARLSGMECIECGCCAYVCPAKRPLTQRFKEMKRLVAADRRAKAQAAAEAEAKRKASELAEAREAAEKVGKKGEN